MSAKHPKQLMPPTCRAGITSTLARHLEQTKFSSENGAKAVSNDGRPLARHAGEDVRPQDP